MPPSTLTLWRALQRHLYLVLPDGIWRMVFAPAHLHTATSTEERLTVALPDPQVVHWLNLPMWHEPLAALTSKLANRPMTVHFSICRHPSPGGPCSTDCIPHPPPSKEQPMSFHRIRIYSHLTRTTFLHVEDALAIGKVRLFAGRYTDGADALLQHYIDVPDARAICHALAQAWHDFEHHEFKGTPLDDGTAISRVLHVRAQPERVFFELARGPGRLTATGAISPGRRDDPAIPRTQVNVLFEWPQARRMALEILAFLHAWDVARLLAHRPHLSGLPPFPLSPSAGEEDRTPDSISPPEARHEQLLAVTPQPHPSRSSMTPRRPRAAGEQSSRPERVRHKP